MRVATRRLRAALEVFEPCFPAGQFADALAEVKAIADALGERRDRDVDDRRARAVRRRPRFPGSAGRREPRRAPARPSRREANAELEAFVSSPRLAALSERLSELVIEAEALAGGQGGEGEAGQEARPG